MRKSSTHKKRDGLCRLFFVPDQPFKSASPKQKSPGTRLCRIPGPYNRAGRRKLCYPAGPTRTSLRSHISGWADLNRRPHVPQTCTLNHCATARKLDRYATMSRGFGQDVLNRMSTHNQNVPFGCTVKMSPQCSCGELGFLLRFRLDWDLLGHQLMRVFAEDVN